MTVCDSSELSYKPLYSRLQKSCNKQAEQWKTTIDLLCLNREVGHAEAGKIIIFICGKSIVVFHCFSLLVARLLQSAVTYVLVMVTIPHRDKPISVNTILKCRFVMRCV